MTDTSAAAEELQMRLLQAMTPARRLALALGWTASLRALIRGQLRQQWPEASERQLHRLFADRWLGPELAAKAYGPLPPSLHG